jgi:hypothetical protein
MDVSELVNRLDDKRPEVRYGAGKELIKLSASQPHAVYPYFDAIARRLDGENRILRWNATRVLANLCSVDARHRFDGLLETFLSPLRGPELVAAVNVLGSLARISAARPDLADRLAIAAVAVRRARFHTPECRLVVIGHALRALIEMLPLLNDRSAVEEFARSQLRARRPQVRKAARTLLGKLQAERTATKAYAASRP